LRRVGGGRGESDGGVGWWREEKGVRETTEMMRELLSF
jgi:hypothetical protein